MEAIKDTVGILVFSKVGEELYSVALQKNDDAWSYFGGEKLEGEPDLLAAQRHLRESLGLVVEADELVPFARTEDGFARCALFATVDTYASSPHQWALSQVPKYATEMALDVPVMIEMAKLAISFPNALFFTAEMR